MGQASRAWRVEPPAHRNRQRSQLRRSEVKHAISESPEGWEGRAGREAAKETCTERLFTARAVTAQGYRSSDHQLHLIKISKEVKCTRERGCQKPSMKMSQQLGFYFQCFLLNPALGRLRSLGISFSISPRVCPATKHLSPIHPGPAAFVAAHRCACHPAMPAGTPRTQLTALLPSAGCSKAAPQLCWPRIS